MESTIAQCVLIEGEKLLLRAETKFKFSKELQSHPDKLVFSLDDRKLTAGGIDTRNGDYRIVLSDISFDSSKAYWEINIEDLVSSQLHISWFFVNVNQ